MSEKAKEERSEYYKRWSQDHKEERSEYNKRWRQEHKRDRREYMRQYYEKNKEKLREYNREWRKAHPEAVNEIMKRYYEKHPREHGGEAHSDMDIYSSYQSIDEAIRNAELEIEQANKKFQQLCRAKRKFIKSQAKQIKIQKKRCKITEVCALCENAPVYARGLCRSCYGKYLRAVLPENYYKGRSKEKLEEDIYNSKIKKMQTDTQPDFNIYTAYQKFNEKLSDQQRKAMKMWLDNCTLRRIGEEMGVSRERARQVVNKAARRLREYDRGRQVDESDSSYDDLYKRLLSEEENKNAKEKDIEEETKQKRLKEIERVYNMLSEIKIDDTDLPARAKNALIRSRIMTLGGAFLLVESGKIYQIRNVGDKTLKQIITKIDIEKNKEVKR